MKLVVKVYSIVFLLMFFGGILWSIINGYRYFCDVLQACDQSGVVLTWSEFWQRKLGVVLIASLGSYLITLMLLKDNNRDSH